MLLLYSKALVTSSDALVSNSFLLLLEEQRSHEESRRYLARRPSLLTIGWRPSLPGWRPSLVGWRPLLLLKDIERMIRVFAGHPSLPYPKTGRDWRYSMPTAATVVEKIADALSPSKRGPCMTIVLLLIIFIIISNVPFDADLQCATRLRKKLFS